jgi:glutamate N-acetyltransferase/amino-acid N-acetyltransferase
MATMLCLITTDVRIAPGFLRRLLQGATEKTFNQISVDADMSTNDSVFALASGTSGVIIRPGSLASRSFQDILHAVMDKLAFHIVQDGEGATQVAQIEVVGGRTDAEAQACARQIANSLLVKTMLAGADPNVGRLAAAAGASGAWFNPGRLEIRIGPHRVVARGAVLPVMPSVVRNALRVAQGPRIVVNLQAGKGRGRMTTCDLTEEYVRINARYAT